MRLWLISTPLAGWDGRVEDSSWFWLTVVMPPLHKFEVSEFRIRHHACGSLRAWTAWDHLNLLLSRMPVLFVIVRWTAMARSFSVRKTALSTESGRKKNRTTA